MRWLEHSIKWIMLVSGVLTFTMLYAAFAPKQALASAFGASLDGPVADIVVRNWGALIALVGVLLVYGAFRPASRSIALVVAGLSKLVFIALVLSSDEDFIRHQVGTSVIVDSVMVVFFALYLAVGGRGRAAA